MIVQKTKTQPKKSAAFGGRLLVRFWVLNTIISWTHKIKKHRYRVYLMEHIYFEVQLCIKISIFKEILNIDILIILCLATSLQHCSLASGADSKMPHMRNIHS